MKRSLFLKVCCCLLAICLLSGCAPKSPLLAHADDDTGLNKETAILRLYKASRVTNAEGKEIGWYTKLNHPFEKIEDWAGIDVEPQGNMEHTVHSYDGKDEIDLEIPFSKSFTVYSIYRRLPAEVSAENQLRNKPIQVSSGVTFYTGTSDNRNGQSVCGSWGKAVHHCNNVIELYDCLPELEFTVCMVVDDPSSTPKKESYNIYEIEGKGGDHVIVALADGKVLADGMECNYTVTRTTYTGWERDKYVTVKEEYDKDGNLLSTTEE